MTYPEGWESVSNDVSRAAESAIRRNFTVRQFIQLAEECWLAELHEQAIEIADYREGKGIDRQRFAAKDFEKAEKALQIPISRAGEVK